MTYRGLYVDLLQKSLQHIRPDGRRRDTSLELSVLE
jgi:hypothetical protein